MEISTSEVLRILELHDYQESTIAVRLKFRDYLDQYLKIDLNNPKSILCLLNLIKQNIDPNYNKIAQNIQDLPDIIDLLCDKNELISYFNGQGVILYLKELDQTLDFKGHSSYNLFINSLKNFI